VTLPSVSDAGYLITVLLLLLIPISQGMAKGTELNHTILEWLIYALIVTILLTLAAKIVLKV